jgi:hypothetical protein
MQKKHPHEQKHRRRKPEKLFGLTMPLRINVLTGTPIGPDGSTSIYDILYTRKHAEEGYQRGKEEAEKMDIEEQIRREARAHDTALTIGYMLGRKNQKLAIDPNKTYQLFIRDSSATIKKDRPVEQSHGFDYYADAAERVRAHMGPNAPSTDEILRQLGRAEGVTHGNLHFELYVRKERGIGPNREVKLNRWKKPPGLSVESGPPPSPLPEWGGKRPHRAKGIDE